MDPKTKLVAVVGETASGKSSLALQLAQRFSGELICADSATVRRGMDIGTAKPTADERVLARHHLLDIVEPDDEFSVAQFKERADQAINEIASCGKVPILVGGTGLYIDSVLYDYQFRAVADPAERDRLNALSLQELQDAVTELDVDITGIDMHNPHRLIRLIETNGEDGTKQPLRSEWQDYFLGNKNLAETRSQIIKDTKYLAKRQRTWFKRNKSIHWLTTPVILNDVVASVTTFLAT
jgi:tRNA dimethylallyltransferase